MAQSSARAVREVKCSLWWRREVELMRGRVEEGEVRNQDLAETISQASRPILRQVSLQQAYTQTG